MKNIRVFRNLKALWWVSDTVLIVHKRTAFYFFDVEKKKMSIIVNLPDLSGLKKFLMNFRIFRRIFRLEPSCFTQINDNEYLYCFNSSIYCLDTCTRLQKREMKLRDGLRSTITICASNEGAFYGEYWTGPNPSGEVRIYRRSDGVWEPCFSFQNNQIRHIHKLLMFNGDLYCFTGDEIKETFIVKFDKLDFSRPKIIKSGAQSFRSCCAVGKKDYLFYVTDTPYENNKLIFIDLFSGSTKTIFDVDSSSIFSSSLNGDIFYFSTAIEPNLIKRDDKNIKVKISDVEGGIHSKVAKLFEFNLRDRSIKEVCSLKKDFWPFIFGLGTFIPVPNFSHKYLACYSSCLKKDGSTILIPLHENDIS